MKPYPLILLLLLSGIARSQLTITLTVTNSACGMNNGSVLINASNGVPPYDYSLGGAISGNPNYTALRPGEYLAAARDAAGTIVSKQVFVTNTSIPPVPTFSTKYPTNCDQLDGVLTVIMSGGSPPFQYSLDNITYQTSNVFNNLSHGIYSVYVKDVNGCRNTLPTSANMFAPNCSDIRLAGNLARCGNNGRLSVVAPLPGIAPRKYSLDGINYQDSPTFTDLPPAVYTVRIKDATGTVRMIATELSYYCVMQLGLTATAPGCGRADGSILATPVEGEKPHQYSLNDGPFQTSNQFDFLPAGVYTVKVKDAKNLIVSIGATLSSACATTTTVSKDATCGGPNGELQVNASGGTAPYTYSIDGNSYQASNRFTGLVASRYTVYVKDAANIITTTTADIKGQPVPNVSATTTAASCSDNDGTITAISASGQSPLVYGLVATNFQSAPVFGGLASGNYKLMVKDGNGCADTVDVTVPLANSLVVTLDPDVTICEGKSTSLSVNSNAANFRWAPGAGINNPAMRDQTVAPIATTAYVVTGTTGKCSLSDTVLVIVRTAPLANAGNNQVICFGEDATLQGSGGVMYNWTPARYLADTRAANPTAVRPTATTDYFLSVTDALGCSSLKPASVRVTVTRPKLFAGNDTSLLNNLPFNLNAVDVNKSGFIHYQWQPVTGLSNPGIANPIATLDRTINYRVSARTASGCEGADEISVKRFKAADIYLPNAFTPNGDGHNDYARPVLVGIRQLINLTIYNRWGGVVYRAAGAGTGWDGRLNGAPQNSGLFTWIAVGLDFQGTTIKRSGTITLIR